MAASMDDNMLSCFTPVFASTEKSSNQTTCKTMLLNENVFLSNKKSGHLQEIIGHMHNCLNSYQNRTEGLLLLSSFLDQCNTEILMQNASTWLQYILQIVQSHDPPAVLKITCHICRDFLDATSVFTSLSRDVLAVLPKLLPIMIAAPQEWKPESFMVINSCITNYGGSCGTFKGKIECVVHEELLKEQPSKEVVRCYALLARCGTGGTQGIKHTEGWTVQYEKVMATLESIVHLLYQDLSEDFSPNQTTLQAIPLGQIPESLSDRLPVLTSQFGTFTKCLERMLSEPFPSVVKVPAEDMIQFCGKVLSVTPKWLQSFPSTDRLVLAGYLPIIHTSVISLLNTLIKSLQTLLLPHTKQILSMLVSELIWSHSTPEYGQCKLYSSLRSQVYQTLHSWFQVCKCFIETVNEEESLVEELLHDCKPQVDTMKINASLNKPADSAYQPPSKKKKGGYQELSQGISSQRKVNMLANSGLTQCALRALNGWICSAGSQMKEKSYKLVVDFVMNTSMKVSQNKTSPGIPYSDPVCRLGLLNCVKSIVTMPHARVISPLQCAISILRIASMDYSSQVSSFCSDTLRYFDVLVHPRAPYFTRPKISKDSDVAQNTRTESNFTVPQFPVAGLNFSQSRNESLSLQADHVMQVDSPQPSGSKEEVVSSSSSESGESSDKDSDGFVTTGAEIVEAEEVTSVSGKTDKGKAIVQDTIYQEIIIRKGSVVLGVGEQLVDSEPVTRPSSEPCSQGEETKEDCNVQNLGRKENAPQISQKCVSSSDQSCAVSSTLGNEDSVKDTVVDVGCGVGHCDVIEDCGNAKAVEISRQTIQTVASSQPEGMKEKEEVDKMLMAFMDVDPE